MARFPILHCLTIAFLTTGIAAFGPGNDNSWFGKSWFGGVYSRDPISESTVTVNHLNGMTYCTADYTAVTILEARRSGTSASTISVCFRNNLADESNNFGGAFSVCYDGNGQPAAKLGTPNIGTTAVCPSGYSSLQLNDFASNTPTEMTCQLTFCYNFVDAIQHKFGGAYGGAISNPVTNDMSCPIGYVAYPLGAFKKAFQSTTIQYFYCGRPVTYFGGGYQPGSALTTVNAYTGGLYCPSGFNWAWGANIDIWQKGGSDDVWLCLNGDMGRDTSGNFRGAFQWAEPLATDTELPWQPRFGEVELVPYEGVPNRGYACSSSYLTAQFNVHCKNRNCKLGFCYTYTPGISDLAGFFSTVDPSCSTQADAVPNLHTGAASCPSGHTAYSLTENAISVNGHCRMRIAYCGVPRNGDYKGFFAVKQPGNVILYPNPLAFNSFCDPGYVAYAISSHVNGITPTDKIVVYACLRKRWYYETWPSDNFRGAFTRCASKSYYLATPEVSSGVCPVGTAQVIFVVRDGEQPCDFVMCFNNVASPDVGGFFAQDRLTGDEFPNPVTTRTTCPSGYYANPLTVTQFKVPSINQYYRGFAYWCAVRQTWFGGYYSTNDGGAPQGINSQSGKASCIDGFDAHQIAQFYTSSDTQSRVFVCLRRDMSADAAFNFGGAFSTCLDGTVFVTPNIHRSGPLVCPPGYDKQTISGLQKLSSASNDVTTCDVSFCYQPASNWDHDFGGLYSSDRSVLNPLTSVAYCPFGFMAYPLSTMKTALSTGTIFYCARPNSNFGGFYQRHDDPSRTTLTTQNIFTSALNCPAGFSATKIGRLAIFTGGYGDVFICTRTNSKSDPTGNFGGAYQLSEWLITDTDSNHEVYSFGDIAKASLSTPVGQIANRILSCPYGYTASKFSVRCGSPVRNCTLAFCFNYKAGAEMAGFYSTVDNACSSKIDVVVNPVTGSATCPQGYSPKFVTTNAMSHFTECRISIAYCSTLANSNSRGLFTAKANSLSLHVANRYTNYECDPGYVAYPFSTHVASASFQTITLYACQRKLSTSVSNFVGAYQRCHGSFQATLSMGYSTRCPANTGVQYFRWIGVPWILCELIVCTNANWLDFGGFYATSIAVADVAAVSNPVTDWHYTCPTNTAGFEPIWLTNPNLGDVGGVAELYQCQAIQTTQRDSWFSSWVAIDELTMPLDTFFGPMGEMITPTSICAIGYTAHLLGRFVKSTTAANDIVRIYVCLLAEPNIEKLFGAAYTICDDNSVYFSANVLFDASSKPICPSGYSNTQTISNLAGKASNSVPEASCSMTICFNFDSAVPYSGSSLFVGAIADQPGADAACPFGYLKQHISMVKMAGQATSQRLSYCGTAAPQFFGGFFQRSDSPSGRNTANAYSNDVNCPPGYVEKFIGRIDSGTGIPDDTSLYVCTRLNTYSDVTRQFGGAYLVPDLVTGRTTLENTYFGSGVLATTFVSGAVTLDKRNNSCSNEYATASFRVRCGNPSRGCTLGICYNKWNALSEFGGFFAYVDNAASPQTDNRINPVTNAMSCPSGYRRACLVDWALGPRCTISQSLYCRETIAYCVPINSRTFGGIYTVAASNQEVLVRNLYTNAASCEPGFVPRLFAILSQPSGYTTIMFLCNRQAFLPDLTSNFVSVRQRCSDVSNQPLLTCPAGSVTARFRLTGGSTGTQFCELTFCLTATPHLHLSEQGGIFLSGPSSSHINPMTNQWVCTAGFDQQLLGAFKPFDHPDTTSVIWICGKAASLYGGMYSVEETSSISGSANHLTGDLSCPKGFTNQLVGRFIRTSSIFVQVFACLRSGVQVDGASVFGGMFTKCAGAITMATSNINALIDTTCPNNYQPIVINNLAVASASSELSCQLTLCYNINNYAWNSEIAGFFLEQPGTTAPTCNIAYFRYNLGSVKLSGSSQIAKVLYCARLNQWFGGQFQIDGPQVQPNAYTGTTGCRAGYDAIFAGTFNTGDSTKSWAKLFVCLKSTLNGDPTNQFAGMYLLSDYLSTDESDVDNWDVGNVVKSGRSRTCPDGYQSVTFRLMCAVPLRKCRLSYCVNFTMPNLALSGGLFSIIQTGASSNVDAVANPVTNSFSCPTGYRIAYTTKVATGANCQPTCQQSLAYCAPLSADRNFGGFFATKFQPTEAPLVNNSFTSQASCEPGFTPEIVAIYNAPPGQTGSTNALYVCRQPIDSPSATNNFMGSFMLCNGAIIYSTFGINNNQACPSGAMPVAFEILAGGVASERSCTLTLCFSWEPSVEQEIGGFYMTGGLNYAVANPITGGADCPARFTGAKLVDMKTGTGATVSGSTLYMCVRGQDLFGGFYSIDESGLSSSLNHLTGAPSCLPGFGGHIIGKFVRNNQGDLTKIYVCARVGSWIDQKNIFGGSYAKCTNGTSYKTPGLVALQCPDGYKTLKIPYLSAGVPAPLASGRIPPEVSCDLAICYNFAYSWDSDFGGMWADQNFMLNPVTESTYGCPAGYFSYYLAKIKIAFLQQYVNVYYCARPNPIFGGFYQMVNDTNPANSLSTPNGYTGDYNCPVGFAAKLLARPEYSRSLPNIFVCLKPSLIADPSGQFGGAFIVPDYVPSETVDLDSFAVGSVTRTPWRVSATSTIINRNFSCTPGFRSVSFRIKCGVSSLDCTLTMCFNFVFGGNIGGFFAYTNSRSEGVKNPVTNEFSCPVGYQMAYVAQYARGVTCGACRKWISYCAAFSDHRSFGGIFAVRIPQTPLIANSYTGTTNCMPGFVAYSFANVLDLDGPPGVILYACTRPVYRTAANPSNFCGAFQKCDTVTKFVLATPNIGNLQTCPSGCTPVTYTLRHGETSENCQLVICYRFNALLEQDFGGVFMTSSQNGVVLANAITQKMSCPPKFAPTMMLKDIIPQDVELTSDIEYCVRSTSFFGGFYAVEEGGDGYVNHRTGATECPYGYTTQLIGRLARTANIYTLLFLCTQTGVVSDPYRTFGGAFTLCDDGSLWTSNTIPKESPSCPDDYQSLSIDGLTRGGNDVSAADSKCKITICYNAIHSYETEFNGAYAINAAWNLPNPETTERSCGPGFTAYSLGIYRSHGTLDTSGIVYCSRPMSWFGGFYALSDGGSSDQNTANAYTGGYNCSENFVPNFVGTFATVDNFVSLSVCLRRNVKTDPTRQLGAIVFMPDSLAYNSYSSSDPLPNAIGDGAWTADGRIYSCKSDYQTMNFRVRCGNPLRGCTILICFNGGMDLGGFYAYPEDGAIIADLRNNPMTNNLTCPPGYSIAHLSEWAAGDACDPCRQWLAYCSPVRDTRTFGGFFSVQLPNTLIGPNVFTGVAECEPGFTAFAFSKHVSSQAGTPNIVMYSCERNDAISLFDRNTAYFGAYQLCDWDPTTIGRYTATPTIGTSKTCPISSSFVSFRLRGGSPERLCQVTFCFRFDYMSPYDLGGLFLKSNATGAEFQQNNPITSAPSCPIGHFPYLLSQAKPMNSEFNIASLYYCAKPNAWFGGFMAIHDDPGTQLNQANDMAISDLSCQPGFVRQRIARIYASSNGQVENGIANLYACTKATLKADPMQNFGGAFITHSDVASGFDFGTSNLPIVNNRYACPASYRSVSWPIRCGPLVCSFTICYNQVENGDFGGVFDSRIIVKNPWTGTRSCPSGYKTYVLYEFGQTYCSPFCNVKLYYCGPTNRRTFGGMFSVRLTPALVWPNVYHPQGEASCEPGFQPYIFSRHLDPILPSAFIFDFVCLRLGLARDKADKFGGAFQKCPTLATGNVIQDDYRTPGISSTFVCPNDLTGRSITYLVMAGEPLRSCQVKLCFNKLIVSAPFGGFFTVAKAGSASLADSKSNTLTGTQSCPAGYETHALGRSFGPTCNCEMRHFYCRLPTRQFGGFFSDDGEIRLNPFTGATSCPDSFTPRQISRVANSGRWINTYVCLRSMDDPFDSDPAANFFGASQRCSESTDDPNVVTRDSYYSDDRIASLASGCPQGALEMAFPFMASTPLRQCTITICLHHSYRAEVAGFFTRTSVESSIPDLRNNKFTSSKSCPVNYVAERLLSADSTCVGCLVDLYYCRPNFPPATKDTTLLELNVPLQSPIAVTTPSGGTAGVPTVASFFAGFFCQSDVQPTPEILPNPYTGAASCQDGFSSSIFAKFVDWSLRANVECYACLSNLVAEKSPPPINADTNFVAAYQECPPRPGQTSDGRYSTLVTNECPIGTDSTSITVLNFADATNLRECTITICYKFDATNLNPGVTFGGIFTKVLVSAPTSALADVEKPNDITTESTGFRCPEGFAAYLVAKPGRLQCNGACQLYWFYCRPDQSYFGGFFGISTKSIPNTYVADSAATCPKQYTAERFARVVRAYVGDRPNYIDWYVCLKNGYTNDPQHSFGGAFMTCENEQVNKTYSNLRTSNLEDYVCPTPYRPITFNMLGSKPPQPCKVTICFGSGSQSGQLGGMFSMAENSTIVFADQTLNPKTNDVLCPPEYTTHTVLKAIGLACPNCLNSIKQCKLIGANASAASLDSLFPQPSCLADGTTIFEQPRMPNIDYLGSGYDIYFGNPHPSESIAAVDPGYRGAIFNLATNCEQLTADRRYTIPKNVTVRNCLACSMDSKTSEISSTSQYAESLKIGVHIAAGFPKGSFSASADYKSAAKSMKEFNHFIYEQTARCMIYCAMIELYTPPPLTEDFRKAVSTLPFEYENTPEYAAQTRALDDFIDNYGTHIASDIRFGSMYGKRNEICSTRVGYFKSMQLDIAAQLRYNFLFSSVSAAASFGISQERSNEVSSSTSKTSIYSVGSRPPLAGSADEWLVTAYDEPMPINVKLVPITNILAPEYFPSDPMILQRRAILEDAIDDYCHRLSGAGLIEGCVPTDYRSTRSFYPAKEETLSDFFIITRTLTFFEAELACMEQGSQLVKIDASNFNTLRQLYFAKGIGSAWVGVHRNIARDTWQYVDGTSFDFGSSFYMFIGGQPDNMGGTESCLSLAVINNKFGLNDYFCFLTLEWTICRRGTSPAKPSPLPKCDLDD